MAQFTSAPVVGQLSDRPGHKRVLMASQILAAASLLPLAVAPTVVFVLIARVMFGLTAGNVSASTAYIADHTDAAGYLMAGSGHGGIMGAGLVVGQALYGLRIGAAVAPGGAAIAATRIPASGGGGAFE